jgi:hypothetical protein
VFERSRKTNEYETMAASDFSFNFSLAIDEEDCNGASLLWLFLSIATDESERNVHPLSHKRTSITKSI